jgi:hypothetical protein
VNRHEIKMKINYLRNPLFNLKNYNILLFYNLLGNLQFEDDFILSSIQNYVIRIIVQK